MRAIRLRKRVGGKPLFAVHWLTDDGLPVCGRKDLDLDAGEELWLDELPRVEACGGCVRTLERTPIHRSERAEGVVYGAGAVSKGRLSKEGPLRQTAKSGHGREIRQ